MLGDGGRDQTPVRALEEVTFKQRRRRRRTRQVQSIKQSREWTERPQEGRKGLLALDF